MRKKLSTLFGLAIAGALMLGVTAQANQIPFASTGGGSGITLTPNTPGSGDLQLSFSGLAVSGSVAPDTLAGAGVNLNATPSLVGPVSSTTVGGITVETAGFINPNGTIDVNPGNAGGVGELTGNISFINIVSTSAAAGQFNVNMGLTGVTVTAGSSALLNTFAGTPDGSGSLSFTFSGGNFSDLVALLGATATISTSVSGTIAVPEPASLALLGTGLLALGFFFKRRIADAAGLDLQA